MGEMYSAICEWGNIQKAHRKAAKGKRGKQAAAEFEYRLADNLLQIQEDLACKIYRPGPYNSFYVHEPKRRLISAAPFRDRVVHHSLCNIIGPMFEKSFIHDSYTQPEMPFGHGRAAEVLRDGSTGPWPDSVLKYGPGKYKKGPAPGRKP